MSMFEKILIKKKKWQQQYSWIMKWIVRLKNFVGVRNAEENGERGVIKGSL